MLHKKVSSPILNLVTPYAPFRSPHTLSVSRGQNHHRPSSGDNGQADEREPDVVRVAGPLPGHSGVGSTS